MADGLTRTGIAALGEVPWGTHFCHFYQTKEDLLDILVPFFQAGLDDGEFCVWVVADPLRVEEAEEALRGAVPGADRRLEAGDIEIISSLDWYLENGVIAPARAKLLGIEKLTQALARGYPGMRINGEASLEGVDWRVFTEYERRFQQEIAGRRVLVLCTFPLNSTGAAELLDIAHMHQFAAIRRQGRWEILETPELKHAKREIQRLNEQLEARVAERTTALAAANRELERRVAMHEKAEEELRRQKEVLQSIFDYVPVMIGWLDAAGKIRLVNREWERVLGWTLEEIVAQNLDIRAETLPDPAERERAARFLAESNAEWADFKLRVRDGRILDTAWAVVHLSDTTAICIGQDMTGHRMLEDQLRQAQKMEAVGQLAGGIAHDFNNLITIINGYCALLSDHAARDAEAKEELRQITEAAARAALLTRRLLEFSRRQIIRTVVTTLNAVIAGFEPMLRRLIPEHIELSIQLWPEAGQVKVDPSQLEQVLMNLAVNSRDAMPRGGRLTIRTARAELDDEYARLNPEVKPGSYESLIVSDTGTGMSDAIRTRIFEPFFTTKEAGMGSGLGLSVVYGVVRQSGGHIEVASRPDAGTTFTVYLPSAAGPVDDAAGQAPNALPRGSETILLVEDDAAVRGLTHRVLKDRGYTIIAAGDGHEALARWDSGTGIDLLLTDVVMPGMSGPALADAIQSKRPDLKVLFVSGYIDDATVRAAVIGRNRAFLPKPFSPEALTQKIREVLDGPAGSGEPAA